MVLLLRSNLSKPDSSSQIIYQSCKIIDQTHKSQVGRNPWWSPTPCSLQDSPTQNPRSAYSLLSSSQRITNQLQIPAFTEIGAWIVRKPRVFYLSVLFLRVMLNQIFCNGKDLAQFWDFRTFCLLWQESCLLLQWKGRKITLPVHLDNFLILSILWDCQESKLDVPLHCLFVKKKYSLSNTL